MSQPTVKPTTSTEVPATDHVIEGVVVEKKPNVFVRAARKIRSTPPKTAIALTGGVLLVAAGTVLGRKTAPYHVAVVEGEFVPEPLFEVPASDSDDKSA